MIHSILTRMRSTAAGRRALEELALAQGGYFDRRDALDRGVSDDLLGHHTSTGRFERVAPGVYRLAVAPFHPQDELIRAWVWTNYRGVISHDSALALLGLSDLLPNRLHLTVPRGFRRETGAYVLHYRDLPDSDQTTWEGLPVTTAARTIVDAAADGADPEQVGKAIAGAVARGLATPEELRRLARRPAYRGRRLARPLVERELRRAVV